MIENAKNIVPTDNGQIDMLRSKLSLDEPQFSPGLRLPLQRTLSRTSSNEERASLKARRRSEKSMSIIEFASTNYAVMENEKRVIIQIERYGNLSSEERFKIETFDGTAQANINYRSIQETKIFYANQTKLEFDVKIIDNVQANPDKIFFVKLSPLSERSKIGPKAICMVTIIDDDSKLFTNYLV
jgi:hypothetical protein